MGIELQAHLAFHLTGKRMGGSLQGADGLDLRPGLLARFGDLTQLRYDFPLVLVADRADETAIQSLRPWWASCRRSPRVESKARRPAGVCASA
jgi:hypothetical protein